MRALSVSGIIRNGYATGLKNALSLIGAVFLWALTCWIPYLNVGTTIGLLGLVAAMSKGDVISPTAIFRSDARKQMGEFFLVVAFMGVGIFIGSTFLIIPGIVIAVSWGLAPLLVIDKGLNPTEALQRSNNLTAGRKWTIFLGTFLTSLTVMAATALLSALGAKLHVAVGALISFVGLVLSMTIGMGAQAYIYGVLTDGRPAHASDEGSAALSWGAFGGAIAAMALAGVVTAIGGGQPAESKDSDFAMPRASKKSRELAREEVAQPEEAATPEAMPALDREVVQLQAPALAAEFLKSASKATRAYDGKSLQLTGIVKEVDVSPLLTTVDFEVPELEGKFNRVTAVIPARVRLRKGEKATIRGLATVIDLDGITVSLVDAELISKGNVAGVRR